MSTLQWAIVGLGDTTSSDFVQSMKLLSKDEHRVIAVYDENQKHAEEFAIIYKVQKTCRNITELASFAKVQAVFVNLPPEKHYEVVKMMLTNGKSVLCQPPLGLNQKQTEKLISLARETDTFLMEGFWSRCFPAYKFLEDCFVTAVIGEVVHLQLDFGFRNPSEMLSGSPSYLGGALLYLGPTLFQFVQLVFHALKPQAIVVGNDRKQSENFLGVIVKYDQCKMAVLSASLLADLSNEATIYGTAGYIKVKDFWCPTTLTVNGSTKTFPLLKNPFPFNYHNGAGYAYEAEEVRSCILAGKIESQLMTHDESLILIKLLDEMRLHIGATFPEDFADIENIGGKDNQ